MRESLGWGAGGWERVWLRRRERRGSGTSGGSWRVGLGISLRRVTIGVAAWRQGSGLGCGESSWRVREWGTGLGEGVRERAWLGLGVGWEGL